MSPRQAPGGSSAPTPLEVTTLEALTARLRSLRAWAGISYREVHRRVVSARTAREVPELPAFHTVYNCFQPGRVRLDVELVVDVARALLGDEALAEQWRCACRAVAGRASAAAIVNVTGELPEDHGILVGRDAEIEDIVRLSTDGAGQAGPVAVIHGMAGTGKTRLAVRAAHALLRDGRHADLQLSVDLHGFHPNRPPAAPGAVLDGFLRRLGVPGHQIHHLDLAGRAARYRQLMAGRNALVLLDNAATVDQVRPLLPHQPTCMVLVTSRASLAGLAGVRRIRLDALGSTASVDLLRARVTPGVIDGDLPTAQRIADVLGHLPLALCLVAARIRDAPDWSLTDHLDRLVRHRANLKLEQAVEAALDLSYHELPRAPQRMFRLLALHPGDQVDADAAGALAGADPATGRRHLDQLVARNLVQRVNDQYVRFHDLVRIHAIQRGYDDEPSSARDLAMARLFDHYVRTAMAAVRTLYPHRWAGGADSAVDVTTPARAKAWLDTEHPNLMAAAGSAADGWPRHAIDLSASLWPHLDTRGRHADALTLHSYALAAAREIGDRTAELNAHRAVGTAYHRLGDYATALEHHRRSLAMARAGGDRRAECYALGNVGVAYERLGRYADALDHYHRTLAAARESGERTAEGYAQSYLGFIRDRLGRRHEAHGHYREALRIVRETGNRLGEGYVLRHLGVACARTGRLVEAQDHHTRALAIAIEVGDRAGEAYSRTYLGVVHTRRRQHADAVACHQRALAIATETGDRELELDILNCFGQSLSACGRSDDALAHHRRALTLASATGDRYEQARAHHGLAAAHLALAQPGEARAHRDRAEGLCAQLGIRTSDEAWRRFA